MMCDIEEFEVCVSCGITTDTLKNANVGFRRNYIDGDGQLCEKCYKDIYSEKYCRTLMKKYTEYKKQSKQKNSRKF